MDLRYRQIPESLLARLWQSRASRSGPFTSVDGRRFRVLYPGRLSSAAGPDFRDALVEEEGVGLLRGDVELHIRQREWDSHGHGQDARYNGVVLHGVLDAQGSTTTLPGGAVAPTLNLAPLFGTPSNPVASNFLWDLLEQLGYHQPANTEEAGRLLDRAGDERFLAKSASYSIFLREEEPQQVLYEAIMEAMGYSRNRQPFLHLAQHLPYSQLRRRLRTISPQGRGSMLRRILFRGAGFLPNGASGAKDMVLNPHPKPPVAVPRWHLFRIRPENHPRRRLLGVAFLLDRYWERGLLAGLEILVREDSWHPLERGLTVKGEGSGPWALIGKARAGDTAVNGLLPFFHSLGTLRGDGELRRRCLELYQSYPRLQHNEITKEMAQRLLTHEAFREVNSARRQQGLIHMHRLIAGEHHGVRNTA